MRLIKSVLAAAAFVATFFGASLMSAPEAAAQASGGAATVIVLDYERIVAQSAVGQNISQQFQQIGQAIQQELAPEQQSLAQEQQRIAQSTQGMTAEQVRANSSLTQQINQFNQRIEAFRNREIAARRDIEYTRQVTLAEFNQQITPYVRQVMEARGAGIVLDSSAAQLTLPAYDATADVVARLDQNMRTMTVTRRTAPPPQDPNQPAPAGN